MNHVRRWSRVHDVAHCFHFLPRVLATTSLCGTELSFYNHFETAAETGVGECFTCKQLALTEILLSEPEGIFKHG